MTTKTTAKSDAVAMVLSTQFAESTKLEQAIKANLTGLGYGS